MDSEHVPCDVGTLSDGAVDNIQDICVVAGNGPYNPVKLALGNALASVNDAPLHLEYRAGRYTTDHRKAAIEAYHGDIRDVVESTGQTAVTRSDGGRVGTPDLMLVNTADGIALDRPEPVLTVHIHDRNWTGRLRRLLERLSF